MQRNITNLEAEMNRVRQNMNTATPLPANYIRSKIKKNQRRWVASMLILCLFNGLCRVGTGRAADSEIRTSMEFALF